MTIQASTSEPLTAADFELRYDTERTFPFFEDDDGRIFGYGHPARAEAAEAVQEYYRYTAGEGIEVHASDIHHRWAVRTEPSDDLEFSFVWAHRLDPLSEVTAIGPDESGAFPIWTASL